MYVLYDGTGWAADFPIEGPCGTTLFSSAKQFATAEDAVDWARKNGFVTGGVSRGTWAAVPASEFAGKK